MTSRPAPRWLSPLVMLPVAVLVGCLLRLTPCLRDPGFAFVVDAAYHERLTRETLALGHLPGVDRLSNAPEGRRTADHLPVGLYAVGAGAHRVLSGLGSRDLRWNLALLMALAGALVAVPVWLGTRAVSGSASLASLAALVAVFLPAHLQRTHGFYYRYDGLGTLLATLHGALALAALADARVWRGRALALGSAVALVAAAWVWRMSLVLVPFELAFTAFLFARHGARPALRDLWLVILLVGTPGLGAIPYLGQHGFLLSPLWLGTAALTGLLALPVLGPSSRAPIRIAALLAAAALAGALGRLAGAGDYAALPALLAARIGLLPGHDPVAALMSDVQELRGTSLWSLLVGPRQLSVLGAWLVASPLLVGGLARRSPAVRQPDGEPAAVALAFVTACLVLTTLLFERTMVLLAPFAAMALGALAARMAAAAGVASGSGAQVRRDRSPARARPRSRAPGRGGTHGTLWRWTLAALAASALAAVVAGVIEAGTSWSRLDRNEQAALRYLSAHAARDAIVACDWDAGYDVQARTGRATVVDGLLESAENRRRIVELYAALMDRAPDALRRFCDRYHATWLLVPPGSAIYSMAVVTGDPLAAVLARGEPVEPGPLTDHVIVHLVANDVDLPGFRRAFTAGGFQVYEVAGPARP